jgi:hypothetical protein
VSAVAAASVVRVLRKVWNMEVSSLDGAQVNEGI